MKIRKIFIIIFLSALAVVLVFAAYRMLSGLQEKKVRYDVDLYTLVPADCKAVVRFRDAPGFFSHPITAGISGVLWDSMLNKLITNDLLLSIHPEGAVLYKKMASEEIDAFLLPINSGFKAETRQENNIKIHIITTMDDRFFCYFYHQGVWVGSLRKRLIDKVIGNLKSSNTTLRTDSLFNRALRGLGDNVTANVVINADSIEFICDSVRQQNVLCSFPRSWVGFDLSKMGGNLWLSGIVAYDTTSVEGEKHLFHPELLPYHSFLAYQPCDGKGYDVCFTMADSVSKSGCVKVLPIESREHYNESLNEELMRKEVFIYKDYALFANSDAIIDSFMVSLNDEPLKAKNPLVKLFATFAPPKEDGFAVDLGILLCDTIPSGLIIPPWLQALQASLAPYSLYYYTYTDEEKRFFNLILSPK